MPNLRGLWVTLLGPGMPARTATICSSIILLLALAYVFRERGRASLRIKFALLLIVTVLVSYHCYAHDATLLVPAALLLTGATAEGSLTWSRVPVWIVIAAIFVDAFVWPHSTSVLWMAVLMLTMAALLIAQVMTRKRACLAFSWR